MPDHAPYRPAVLGIDPGPEESAYAVWDGVRIADKGKVDNTEMIDMLGRQTLTFRFGPGPRRIVHVTRIAVEMVCSFGMPVGADVFETVFWIGRFCQRTNLPHTRVLRRDIKMHICNSSRANDSNIKHALVERFAPGKPNFGKGTKKKPGFFHGVAADMWQAFAACVVWWDQSQNRT